MAFRNFLTSLAGLGPYAKQQSDMLSDPRRAVPEGDPRRMGAFPAVSDWQAETDAAPNMKRVGIDTSLPNVPRIESFDEFQSVPIDDQVDNPPGPVPRGLDLPRLPSTDSFPAGDARYEDDPRAVARNARVRELTTPGRYYSGDEQDKIMGEAQKSVDAELSSAALARLAAVQQKALDRTSREKVADQRDATRRLGITTTSADRRRGQDITEKIAGQELDLRTRVAAFTQALGLNQTAFNQQVTQIELDQKARGLTDEEKRIEDAELGRQLEVVKARGGAGFDNNFLAKAYARISGRGQTEQERGLQDLARPVARATPGAAPRVRSAPLPEATVVPKAASPAGAPRKNIAGENEASFARNAAASGFHGATPAEVQQLRDLARQRGPGSKAYARWKSIAGEVEP